MHRARDELLAYAALPPDQHGDVAVGHLLDEPGDCHHPLAAAPHRPILIIAQLLAQLVQFKHKPALLDGALDRRLERDLTKALGVVGLDHVVRGAKLHGFDDRRGTLTAREHDRLQLRACRLEVAECLEAVHARHHHVEQHDVRRIALSDGRQHLVPARVGPGLVPAQREKRPEVGRERRVVVHDCDQWFLHERDSLTGSRMVTTPRRLSCSVDQTRPPACSMTRRAIGRPRPMPPGYSLKRRIGAAVVPT